MRKRFTAAHELGHYIYHRDRIGSGVNDNRKYRGIPHAPLYNDAIQAKEETEANRFAANLLMPKHLIDKLKKDGIESVEDLARSLGVSRDAMRIRLGLPIGVF